MFTTETLVHAGQTFLMLFGELFSLFIGISFVVALLQIYISQERIKCILTTPKKGLNSIIGALLGSDFESGYYYADAGVLWYQSHGHLCILYFCICRGNGTDLGWCWCKYP